MLIFRNPGLIELDAIRTMGVSVKQASAFGRFGTGFKYAIATILRGGGFISLYRGEEVHTITTLRTVIRGEDFDLVCLDGESMGFTTMLGRDWEPWMALRELACNAMDEGGDFFSVEALSDWPGPIDHETTIVVNWDKLQQAHEKLGDLFIRPGEERLAENSAVQVLAGPSAFLYYRGVRVYKLEYPSKFKYNLTCPMQLTEDRTLHGDYTARQQVRDLWLTCKDTDLLEQALVDVKDHLEYGLKYEDQEWITPSKAFLDVVLAARSARRQGIAPGAAARLGKHMREAAPEDRVVYRSQRLQDDLAEVCEALEELGLEMAERKFVVIDDELPGEALSMVEGGRIYLHRSLLRQGHRPIGENVLARILELDHSDTQSLIEALVPILLNLHITTRATHNGRTEPENDLAEVALDEALLGSDPLSVDVEALEQERLGI